MKLLLGKEVEHIIINDIDRSIYSIWKLILSDNDELASFIQSVPLTIDEWRKQKEIVTHQTDYDDCELGLASFFMNRTNVSGIISGGPIGGTRQNSKYKIDARFNRDGLLRKINEIKKRKVSSSVVQHGCSETHRDSYQKNRCFIIICLL